MEEVIELLYIKDYRVFLFKRKWFDTDRRRKHVIYEPHCISIDTSREAYKEDPFVFATQVRQVFYIDDPSKSNPNWKIIQRFHHRHLWDIPDDEEDVDHILDEFGSPSDSLAMLVEMTDFNNVAFDRDDVPTELADHITSLKNDDSSNDDTDADDTLGEYNDKPSVDHDSDDNNSIIGSDVVESDDEEE